MYHHASPLTLTLIMMASQAEFKGLDSEHLLDCTTSIFAHYPLPPPTWPEWIPRKRERHKQSQVLEALSVAKFRSLVCNAGIAKLDAMACNPCAVPANGVAKPPRVVTTRMNSRRYGT